MRKTLPLLILLSISVLAGGYFIVRHSLQSSVNKEAAKTGGTSSTTDTLGGKRVSDADLRPLFIKRMQQLLKKSSNGLYDLSIADLKLDLLTSSVALQKVKMQPDAVVLDSLKKRGEAPGDVFTVSFDSLRIEGIDLADAISHRTMDYKLVKLVNPVIIIHHQKGVPKKGAGKQEGFSALFLKEMDKLSVKKISIEEGSLAIYDGKSSKPNKLDHLSVALNDLLIDSATLRAKDRFLFAKEATVSFKDFVKPSNDGLYTIKIGNTVIKEPQQEVKLTDFSYTSPLSKEEFTHRQTFSTSLYHFTLPSITFRKIAWWNLLNTEEFIADDVTVEKGTLAIYLNRSLPSAPMAGDVPNQVLARLPVPLNIKQVTLRDVDLSYEEFNPLSQQSGTVYIDKIKMAISHLANNEGRTAKPFTVNATALFMHQVPLKAALVFPMDKPLPGPFTARINVQGFDGTIVNSFAVPMGMMKLESGVLQGAEATIKGNRRLAGGEVVIPYTNLKIALLKKDKGSGALDKKGLVSFAANLFVLKKENPKEAPRKEAVEYKSTPEGGFFMLIWKTLLVGALKTMGAPVKMAYATTDHTNKK